VPGAPGQGRILGGVAEGEERQGEGGRGDPEAEQQQPEGAEGAGQQGQGQGQDTLEDIVEDLKRKNAGE